MFRINSQYLALPPTRRLVVLDLAICALALTGSLFIFWVYVETPDWFRFLDQAKPIAAGEGFRTGGRLETYLPPGYPVFVAALILLDLDGHLPLAQIVMRFLTVVLVYGAVVRISRALALPLAMLLAVNPLASRLSGYLLSETLGAFLCATACFLLVDVLKRRHWSTSLLLGAVGIALILTSPATIFLAFAILSIACFVAIQSRRFKAAAAIVLGAAIVMLPWQTHCYHATGSVCYLIYSTNPLRIAAEETDGSNLVYQWLRTWSLGERHIHVLHRNNPGGAPDWAFARRADKELFPDKGERLPDGLSPEQRLAISEDLVSKSGYLRLFAFTIVRSVSLWLDMPHIGHAQFDYVFPFGLSKLASSDGLVHALMRVGKIAFSTLVYALYIPIPLIFFVVVWRSRLSRIWIVHGLFVATLLYTIITAYTAHNEARRNTVFLPAMVLAIAVGVQGRRYAATNPVRSSAEAAP